jgi:hypothetical protein
MAQFVKCGFAGDNFPRAQFPCMVGRPMLRFDEGVTEHQLKVCASPCMYYIHPWHRQPCAGSCVVIVELGRFPVSALVSAQCHLISLI